MKTLQLINYIAENPEYEIINFEDGDLTPIQAIGYVSNFDANTKWIINSSLSRGVLYVYLENE
jgi:hypothetical protein